MGERKVLTSRRREKTTMKNKHEGVTRLVQENLFLLRYYLNTSVTELLLGPNNRVTPSLFFIFLSFPSPSFLRLDWCVSSATNRDGERIDGKEKVYVWLFRIGELFFFFEEKKDEEKPPHRYEINVNERKKVLS
jgi:hypothetical protein|tara:strand:- start:237 stop:638 length:402 start_codon:yes stop_codon:yes gene_type:complete